MGSISKLADELNDNNFLNGAEITNTEWLSGDSDHDVLKLTLTFDSGDKLKLTTTVEEVTGELNGIDPKELLRPRYR